MSAQTRMEPTIEVAPERIADEVARASWQISLDQLRENINHNDDEAQEAIVGAFRWCSEHQISLKAFAQRIGFDSTTLWRIIQGSYTHPTTKAKLAISSGMLNAITRFLELEQERQVAPMEFVVTPTAQKIMTACELAVESNSPVWIWGPSHIGKTWTLRYVKHMKNHGRTYMVELEAACGIGGMVRSIAKGCGIGGKSNTAKLVERIKRALTPNTLLIIDEVHLLRHTYRLSSFFACMEVLRRIIDFSGCGAVLSWTHLDDARAASDGDLVQLWRRGVHKVALPMQPTVGDVTAILKHHKLEFPKKDAVITLPAGRHTITEKPYEILRQVGKEQGLKAICERVRYAKKLAAKRNVRIGMEHLVEAHLIIMKQAIQDDGREWV